MAYIPGPCIRLNYLDPERAVLQYHAEDRVQVLIDLYFH